MIVSGFDGLNATMVIDAVQAKAIRNVLRLVGDSLFLEASRALQMDGHKETADDVKTLCRQFVTGTRKLAENVNEKPDVTGDTEEAQPN